MISANRETAPRFNRGPITIAEWEWSATDPAAVQMTSTAGVPEAARAHQQRSLPNDPKYFSIPQLGDRWQCSRGTVYNRLRAAGAKVLDFAPRGKRGRKVVSLNVLLQIESENTRRLW